MRKSSRTRTTPQRYAPYVPLHRTLEKTAVKNWGSQTFPVEIVERKPGMIKLHYIGWSSSWDTWVPAGAADPVPIVKNIARPMIVDAYDDRWQLLLHDISLEIKKNLTCHRSSDPCVRAQIKCQDDVGEDFVGWAMGKTVWEMESGLGKGWHYRIVNALGDFAYVVENTFKVKLIKTRAMKEFEYKGGAYLEVNTEVGNEVLVTFVKNIGNKVQFERNLSKFIL